MVYMRVKLLPFFLIVVNGCLPGFYGPQCLLCPKNYQCFNNVSVSCTIPFASTEGSRSCYLIENMTDWKFYLLPVHAQAGLPNPSNDTCGCFKVEKELSIVFKLNNMEKVCGIVTSGHELTWIKSYILDYSDDNKTWTALGGLFKGNTNDETPVFNFFPYEVTALYFKLSVVEYFLWPSVKIALLKRNVTVPKCRQIVNRLVSNSWNCSYQCKNGTFLSNSECIPYPRKTDSTNNATKIKIEQNYKKVWSQLHQFGSLFVLEFKYQIMGHMFVKADNADWVSVDLQNWNPGTFSNSVHNDSFWYVLALNIHHGVLIKIVDNDRITTTSHSMWIKHGSRSVSTIQSKSIVKYGMFNKDTHLGDSQSVGYVKCVNSTLNFFNVSNDVIDFINQSHACNRKTGLDWLERRTELYGVQHTLNQFLDQFCSEQYEGLFASLFSRNVNTNPLVESFCK